MTYGGISKSETNLTSFSNTVNDIGAVEQQTAANEQAQSSYDQANYAVQYAAEQVGQKQYEINQQVGQEAEGYASGGVSPGEGTPLSVLNTTRAMGQIEINAITLQGQLNAQLARTQGDIYQQGGLEDVLSAEGQNQAATQQTKIQQAIRNTQQLDSLLTLGISGIFSAGSSAASAAATAGGSDKRLKKNIKPLNKKKSLGQIQELKPVSFNWNELVSNMSNRLQLGFIAQDVEKVVPEAVNSGLEYKLLDKEMLIPVLVGAIQELIIRVQELEGRR